MRVNCFGNGYREIFTSFNGNVHVQRAATGAYRAQFDRTLYTLVLVYSSTVRR